MKINIYDKDWSILTTLRAEGSGTADFNNLTYKSVLNDVGRASFLMSLDNEKAKAANLLHFNRVEITDDDGTVRWVGVIVRKEVRLNMVTAHCFSLEYLLKRRLTPDAEVYQTQADIAVADLISDMNAAEDTGITVGDNDITTAVDITFNRAGVFSALRQISDAVGGQFVIGTDRKLRFQNDIGDDLTASKRFNYVITQLQRANITQFNITDDGTKITSKTYGESNALSSTKENATVKAAYGLLEKTRNFRQPNDQNTLDAVTDDENKPELYSPSITLAPDEADDFEAGDTVKVELKNRLIEIDDDYQVLEKTVDFRGGKKLISLRISDRPEDLTDHLSRLAEEVSLLGREV